MANGMPELGSKISLISKADIRYEGRLFTVDPHECTIALATVRSFGTEDRDTPFPVAPQAQIYDYILFRGSDIKDIRVVNNVNPVPNDPAIMQLSVPPSLGQQSYQQPGYSHPVLGAAMGQYGAPYGAMGGLPQSLSSGMASRPLVKQSSELSREDSQAAHTDQGVRDSPHDSVLELLSGGGGSRSGTPVNLTSRKSPTSDQGVQVTPGVGGSGARRGGGNARQNQQRNRERKESRGDRTESHSSNEQQSKASKTSNVPAQQPQPTHQTQNQSNVQQHQPQGQNRGQTNQNRNSRQRGRGRGGPQGNYRQQNNTAGGNQRPKNTLKFENDYDFEEANTQFEELRSQFVKLKVGEENKAPVAVNGDVDKKDDSGNETGAGDHEPEEDSSSAPPAEVCYDKAKSFFDNISCEAVERSMGRSQRTDWRTERKLNSETFGVASARRGGYRGRGGYYRGGMYRGGFRGYRGHRGGNRGGAQFLNQNPSLTNTNHPSQQNRTVPIAAAAGN